MSTNLEIFAVYVYLGLFFPESSDGFNQHRIFSVILLHSHQCKTPLSQLDPHLIMLNNFLSSSGLDTSLFIFFFFFPEHQQTCRTAQDPCMVSLIPLICLPVCPISLAVEAPLRLILPVQVLGNSEFEEKLNSFGSG